VLWGTGRGGLLRTGALETGSLCGSTKTVSHPRPDPGDTLSYTLRLVNPGPLLASVRVTDTLPLNATLLGGSVAASSGSWAVNGGTLTWTGPVTPTVGVTLTYQPALSAALTQPTVIANTALLDDGQARVLARTGLAIVNGLDAFLPLRRR
jgi:uncharacterized repeat protein (TIGR01451 family)